MVFLRNFKKEDASELREYGYSDLSAEQVEALICDWEKSSSTVSILKCLV